VLRTFPFDFTKPWRSFFDLGVVHHGTLAGTNVGCPRGLVCRLTYRGSIVSVSEAAVLYRLHAAQYIDIAHRSIDPESRLSLFDMASSWRMLADQADKNAGTATPEPRQPR
jgi:hypothetical protein